DVTHLALAELGGWFGFHKIVDAGAAAADLRLGGSQHLDAGNRPEEIAGLGPDPLRVGEMTGVVVDDPRGDRMPNGARLAELDEGLGDVADSRAELTRALGPFGIVGEQ